MALLGQVYVLGCRMSEPEKMLEPMPGEWSVVQQEVFSRYEQWLVEMNLEFRTAFKFGTIQTVVFQEQNLPRFLSILFHKRVTFSVDSYMEDLTNLCTDNSGNLGLFPRPGSYNQSYPNTSPQELWKRHLEGEAYLSRKFGCQWAPLTQSFEEVVLASIRLKMQYNRSQFMWPVRVLYRYFVTCHLLKNRSIMEQYP